MGSSLMRHLPVDDRSGTVVPPIVAAAVRKEVDGGASKRESEVFVFSFTLSMLTSKTSAIGGLRGKIAHAGWPLV